MRKHSSFRFRICAVMLVFFASAFLLPASKAGDSKLYLLAAAVPGVMLLLLLLPSAFFSLDRPALSAALSLCGFGILANVYTAPEEVLSQAMRCVAGLFFLAAGVVCVRTFRISVPTAVVPAVIGLGMLSVQLWLPSLSFSLSECGIVLILLTVTSFLSLRLRLPALLTGLSGLLMLLLQSDYASAGILGLSFLLLFWTASDSIFWTGFSLASTIGFFIVLLGIGPPVEFSYSSLLIHIREMPLLPPESVPESSFFPENLFLLLGEHYGLVFLLCVVLLLVLLLIRGTSLALHTRKSIHASLALTVTLLLGLRGLLFLCSAADLLPVPPGMFPFLTSSMPDLFTDFFLLGLLSGISARNDTDLEEDARLSMLAR